MHSEEKRIKGHNLNASQYSYNITSCRLPCMLPSYASVNLQPRGHCSTLIFLPGRNLWARRVSVWQARAEGGVPEVGAFTKWSLLNLPSLYWAEGYHRRLSHHIMSYHIVSYHVVSFMLIRSGLHSNWKRTLKFTQESISRTWFEIWHDLTVAPCAKQGLHEAAWAQEGSSPQLPNPESSLPCKDNVFQGSCTI